MEAKLKSITKRIPWSSLLKAALLALLRFYFAPFEFGPGALVFGLAAVLLYFIPYFRPGATGVLFLIALALGFFLPGGALAAAALFALYALLFGLKELEIVDRATAYELFAFIALFAAALGAARGTPHWGTWQGPLGALALAVMFYLLARRAPWTEGVSPRRGGAALATVSALVFEIGMAVFVLPIEYLSQACILFTFAVLGFSLIDHRERRDLSLPFLFSAFGAAALVIGLVLTVSSWKI